MPTYRGLYQSDRDDRRVTWFFGVYQQRNRDQVRPLETNGLNQTFINSDERLNRAVHLGSYYLLLILKVWHHISN